MRSRVLICLGLVAALSLAVLAQPAGAASPNAGKDPSKYGGQVTKLTSRADEGSGGGSSSGDADAGALSQRVVSQLPFTGLDLISLGGVAFALLGTGLVFRRLSAARHAGS
jgi:hypothetical protein